MWYQEVTFSGKYKWYDKKEEEYFNKYYDVLKDFIESIRKYQYKFRFNVEDEVIKEEYMRYLMGKYSSKDISYDQYEDLLSYFDKSFFLNLIYYYYGFDDIYGILPEIDILKRRVNLLYPDFKIDEIEVYNHPCVMDPNIIMSISNSKGDKKTFSLIGEGFQAVDYLTDEVKFQIDYINSDERDKFLEVYYLFHGLEFFKVSWNYLLVSDE